LILNYLRFITYALRFTPCHFITSDNTTPSYVYEPLLADFAISADDAASFVADARLRHYFRHAAFRCRYALLPPTDT